MNKFTSLAAVIVMMIASTSVAMALDRPLYACEDGAQTSNPKLCKDHGGVLGSKKTAKSTDAPIDTTKGLTPNTASTTKSKSTSKSASTSTKKKKSTSYAGGSPTAKCNDGAYYYSHEKRGACASHGGVDKWIGF